MKSKHHPGNVRNLGTLAHQGKGSLTTPCQNVDAAPSPPTWLKSHKNGTVLSITAQPGARKNAFDRVHGDAIKLKIQAPPVDGAANDAVIQFLAEVLRVRKSSISILSGEFARRKAVLIEGIALADVLRLLVTGFPDLLT